MDSRAASDADGRADGGLSEESPTTIATGYRPHLDGLRTVAVYLVVAFHAGSQRLAGGFIGVDVFFVLSGYLVTRSLVKDVATNGGIRFKRFYSRRIRRLLPAALLTLLVTAVVFAPLLSPRELDDASGTMRAAAVWLANWNLIGQDTDYFSTAVESNPFAHFWTLSVEEQFYLVIPVLLTVAFLVDRRAGNRRIVVRGLVATLMLASLGLAVTLAPDSLNRAYMGTDSRAYQLLAGCLLALTPGIIGRLGRSRVGYLGAGIAPMVLLPALVLASSHRVDVGPVSRGVLATAITLGLLVTLEAAPRGPMSRLLSLKPIVYLGRISYGTYLWHWPVTLLLARGYDMSRGSQVLLTAFIASAIASLSTHLLELPILGSKRLDRRGGATIAIGLTISVLVAVFAAPSLLEPDPGSRTASVSATAEGTPNNVDLTSVAEDLTAVLSGACPEDLPSCNEETEGGSGSTVMLIGDSHILSAGPMLVAVTQSLEQTLSVHGQAACPWIRGIAYAENDDCFATQDELFEETIAEVDPDLIVLIHRPLLDKASPMPFFDRDIGPVPDDQRAEVLNQRVSETVAQLAELDTKIVIIEPAPVSPAGFDPLQCLSTAEFLEQCRYVAEVEPTSEELLLRRIAEDDPMIWSLDMDRTVCPYLPICDPVVGGDVVKADADHLTVAFGIHQAEEFKQFMLDSGIVRTPR